MWWHLICSQGGVCPGWCFIGLWEYVRCRCWGKCSIEVSWIKLVANVIQVYSILVHGFHRPVSRFPGVWMFILLFSSEFASHLLKFSHWLWDAVTNCWISLEGKKSQQGTFCVLASTPCFVIDFDIDQDARQSSDSSFVLCVLHHFAFCVYG